MLVVMRPRMVIVPGIVVTVVLPRTVPARMEAVKIAMMNMSMMIVVVAIRVTVLIVVIIRGISLRINLSLLRRVIEFGCICRLYYGWVFLSHLCSSFVNLLYNMQKRKKGHLSISIGLKNFILNSTTKQTFRNRGSVCYVTAVPAFQRVGTQGWFIYCSAQRLHVVLCPMLSN
ncbi:hypothetical protein IJ22_37850 [Paenibacillus naphthalenovorans]|uniref:Uncharacterized protein n=1 Tax=Paenibacillus naphthalenovorans TaxID=162209 RepID=A0A0U2IN82_9BACL|nr:hypothetical protein IJ22_37850 [Paenibacillus naphthalenovorans]